MTSKCLTFAKNSSAPKAEDTMVPRGFIVNLVSFMSLIIYIYHEALKIYL